MSSGDALSSESPMIGLISAKSLHSILSTMSEMSVPCFVVVYFSSKKSGLSLSRMPLAKPLSSQYCRFGHEHLQSVAGVSSPQ